jgi:flagellar protein FlaF
MQRDRAGAYQEIQKAGLSDREAEAMALMKAAAMLNHCQTNWSAPDRDAQLDKALRFNQRLWSFFQAALVDSENPLPKKIKENILSLSAFIDKKTLHLMAQPSAEQLDILININTNIAAGLKGQA